MKHSFIRFQVVVIVSILICLLSAQDGLAQDPEVLDVDEAYICRNIVNRKAEEPGTDFPASTGTLYCLTRIVGAKTDTRITHVWYYGNVERARITLPVKSSNWRTYSKKIIRSKETGVWHVDILDSSGNRLEVLNFQIHK